MKSKFEKTTNEVNRKIGRNIILYQKFELMLKYLISRGNVSGYVCDLKDNIEKQTATVMRQTLGQLTGQFLDNTFTEYKESHHKPEEFKEKKVHMSFSFKIMAGEDYYEKTKQILAEIVEERNKLVHQLPLNYKLNSIEGLLNLEQYLDQQHKNLRPEYDNLKNHINTFDKAKKELAEYMQSGEMEKQWRLSDLRQEHLVKLLAKITQLASRSDGWTLLNHAGQLIQQNVPEQREKLNKQYGYKKLKELILATELFDLKEESTDKGGVRVLYRLKKGWELSISGDK